MASARPSINQNVVKALGNELVGFVNLYKKFEKKFDLEEAKKNENAEPDASLIHQAKTILSNTTSLLKYGFYVISGQKAVDDALITICDSMITKFTTFKEPKECIRYLFVELPKEAKKAQFLTKWPGAISRCAGMIFSAINHSYVFISALPKEDLLAQALEEFIKKTKDDFKNNKKSKTELFKDPEKTGNWETLNQEQNELLITLCYLHDLTPLDDDDTSALEIAKERKLFDSFQSVGEKEIALKHISHCRKEKDYKPLLPYQFQRALAKNWYYDHFHTKIDYVRFLELAREGAIDWEKINEQIDGKASKSIKSNEAQQIQILANQTNKSDEANKKNQTDNSANKSEEDLSPPEQIDKQKDSKTLKPGAAKNENENQNQKEVARRVTKY